MKPPKEETKWLDILVMVGVLIFFLVGVTQSILWGFGVYEVKEKPSNDSYWRNEMEIQGVSTEKRVEALEQKILKDSCEEKGGRINSFLVGKVLYFDFPITGGSDFCWVEGKRYEQKGLNWVYEHKETDSF